MTDIKDMMGNIQQGQIPLRLVRTKDGMLYADEVSLFDNVVGLPVGGVVAATVLLLALLSTGYWMSVKRSPAKAEGGFEIPHLIDAP